jgi:Mo-dependent nitrogenase C-terminus
MSNATFVLGANSGLQHNPAPFPGSRLITRAFAPLRQWLDTVEVTHRDLAWFLYKTIPGQCPFERDIVLFGHQVAHIPPLCKLNPLYEQLVGLRFRAMCYLVDGCGEAL